MIGRPGRGAAEIEIDLLRIQADLRRFQVLPSRVIDVLHLRIPTAVFALHGIAPRVTIFGTHRQPVGKLAIQLDRARLDRRQRAGTPVAADLSHHLIVVIVAMSAPHRLDVAAVLLVELIDERDRTRLIERRGVVEAARDPLIPAGNEDERRIQFQRAAIAERSCVRWCRSAPASSPRRLRSCGHANEDGSAHSGDRRPRFEQLRL